MNWWLVYGLLFLAGMFFLPGKPLYSAFYLSLLIVFGLRQMLKVALSSIVVTKRPEVVAMFPGESANLQFSVKNPSLLPCFWISGRAEIPLELKTNAANDWVISLGAREERSINYSIAGKYRGAYTVGPFRIYMGDPLGLYRETRTVELYQSVLVYPRIYPLTELSLPAKLPVGSLTVNKPIQPDPSRFQGARPYQKGDPIRWMHWRATARTQSLQMKEFERTMSLDTAVFLNFDEKAYSVRDFSQISEFSLEVAASLANYLAQHKASFTVLSNNENLPRLGLGRGTHQLMPVLAALARLRLVPATPFASFLRQAVGTLSWGTTLICVTPDASQELIKVCIGLKRRGFPILLLLTGQQITHKELLGPASPFRCYRVNRDSALSLRSG